LPQAGGAETKNRKIINRCPKNVVRRKRPELLPSDILRTEQAGD